MEIALTITILIIFSIFCPKKYIMKYFVISALALSTLAFFYYTTQDQDLFKHYIMLEEFKIGGWQFVLKTHYFIRQPVFAIYSYLIGLLPYNGFLPAITVFLAYILPFSLIYKISKKNNIKQIYMILTYIFILCTMSYLGVMGGIRNMLAFSVFGYFLYVDMVEKKNKILCFFIYIALCLFHSSVIILVILRILVVVAKKTSFLAISIFTLLWSLFSSYLLIIIKKLEGIEFFRILYEQIASITTGSETVYIYSTALVRLCSLIIIFTCIMFCISHYKYIKNYPAKYFRYMLLVILFTFGCIYQYDLFVRMVCFLIFSSPFFIITALNINISALADLSESKYLNYNRKNIVILKYALFTGLIIVSALSILFYTWSEYRKIIFAFVQ